MLNDIKDWLSRPFSEDMPMGELLLWFVIFLVVAFVVWDTHQIIKGFAGS